MAEQLGRAAIPEDDPACRIDDDGSVMEHRHVGGSFV
jgi:hypothetical protein